MAQWTIIVLIAALLVIGKFNLRCIPSSRRVCHNKPMDILAKTQRNLFETKGEWVHIAQKAGVSYRVLRHVAHGDRPTRYSSVLKIARYFARANKGKIRVD